MPCSRAERKSQQTPTGWNQSNKTSRLWSPLDLAALDRWLLYVLVCQVLILFRPAKAGVGVYVCMSFVFCVTRSIFNRQMGVPETCET